MTFLYAAALAVVLLVAAPLVAHLLRRRRTEQRDFPPAHLVPPSPPVARRRRRVDDRALFAVRAASVAALALLGATPFMRCSGLSLGRRGGASLALSVILDDSLSMQARADGTTRWQRAQKGARELFSGLREGDAVAIVLAGAPARIALASTTDLAAARSALDTLTPSHRATDLDGAIELGRTLVAGLPQVDHRIVLLSDLADGHPDGPPIGEAAETALWVPLTDIRAPASDCAVLRADRQRERVTVRFLCSPPEAATGRSIELRRDGKVVQSAPLPAAPATELAIDVAPDAPPDLVAVLSGADAISDDDTAPVMSAGATLAIAVVGDPANAKLVTGGPPPAEQALRALDLDLRVRPLPLLPDHAEELDAFAAIFIDDPPGFTPESRKSVGAWVERGGVAFVTLGPHAAAAPLGANFEPIFSGSVAWGPSPAPGLDDAAASVFGPAAAGLSDFRPHGRASLDPPALADSLVIARWKDHAPWLVERHLGRGLVYVLTSPASPDESDLPLRPAFLALLDRFVDAAEGRNGAHRTEVGQPWTFEGAHNAEVTGPNKEHLAVTDEPTRKVVTPDRIGVYQLRVDGETFARTAAPPEREIDLRPRPLAPMASSPTLGDVRARVDLSPYLGVLLLALLASEVGLRIWARRTAQPVVPAPAP